MCTYRKYPSPHPRACLIQNRLKTHSELQLNKKIFKEKRDTASQIGWASKSTNQKLQPNLWVSQSFYGVVLNLDCEQEVMKNLSRGGIRRLPDFCLAARPMPYFPRCPIFQDFQFKICNVFGSWIPKINIFRPFPPHIRLSMPLLPAWPGLNFPILAQCILVQISLYMCPNMYEYFSNSRCTFSNGISLIFCLKGFPLSGRKRRHRTIFTEAQLREEGGRLYCISICICICTCICICIHRCAPSPK